MFNLCWVAISRGLGLHVVLFLVFLPIQAAEDSFGIEIASNICFKGKGGGGVVGPRKWTEGPRKCGASCQPRSDVALPFHTNVFQSIRWPVSGTGKHSASE